MTTRTLDSPTEPERRASDLHRLAQGSALSLAGSIVAACLNLVLSIVITRSLVREDAGLFFQATALFIIVYNVGTFGADTGVLRFLPRAMVLGHRRDLSRYLVLAVVPAAGLSVLLVGGLLLVADPLSRAVTDDASSAATFRDVLVVLSPWLPVAVVYGITVSASRGLDSVRPLVFVDKIGRTALETGAVAVVATVSTSLSLIALAWVAPYLAMLVVIGVWTRGRIRQAMAGGGPGQTPGARWPDLFSEFWRFSAPRAVSRIFTVALQRVDILVVGALRGPAEAAVYAAATRFLVLGLMFVQAIQQVMTPKISEYLAVGEDKRAEAIYRTTTTWLTLVSWPVYLMAILFAPLLMGVFGAGYDEGSTAAAILCGAMLVATVCGPVDSVLLMAGRSVLSLVNTGLALVTTVGLDLLLVPRLGVTGAALGWAAGILLKNVLALWQVNRYHAMHPLGPGTRTAIGVCVLGFGVVAGAVRLVLGLDLASFLTAGLLGTGVVVLLARRRQSLELAALGAALRRSGRQA